MELFLIYLWLKLDIFIVIAALVGLTGAFLYAFTIKVKRHKLLGFCTLLFLTVSILLPNSKDVAVLVGSAIAISMVKSPEGQKISNLIRGKANEYLDAELNKLQPQPIK